MFRRSPFQAREKLRHGHLEVLCNCQYADDGQVPLASFNTAHVRSVEATDIRKLLLGPSSLGSKLTNALAQRLLHGFVLSFRFSFSHLQSVSKDAIQNVYRSLLDSQHIAYSQMAISFGFGTGGWSKWNLQAEARDEPVRSGLRGWTGGKTLK